jgi:pimeloyl-ACP methyl ester carboxylesterase
MRDPRYRSDAHPESAAFRGWVREGWQAFVAGGEGRTGVVQVRADTRTRNGQPEQVGAHTRGGAAGEDSTGAVAMPVSAAVGTEPPQPRPGITAASPTLVILIGGGGDKKSGIVRGRDGREALRDDLGHRERAYFFHDQATDIMERISTTPAGTRIVIVGHSWGGDRAAQVAAELGQIGRPVDTLITIDPVGFHTSDDFFRRVRLGSREWINVRAVPETQNFSDRIAMMGRRYGDDPARRATRHIHAPHNHNEFERMLRFRDPSGLSALDRMLGP